MVVKMAKSIPAASELIAPCGMNCAVCSNYLAYVNNRNKSQCSGCRPGNKKCTYLFEKCSGINHSLPGNADARFCFECDQYPCQEINRMDRRYRKTYQMSVKDNLQSIKENGLPAFLSEQYTKHHCAACGEMVSVHNKKCFHCDTIAKLVDKTKS